MPRLLIEKGPDKGRSIVIPAGKTTLIGRDTPEPLQLNDNMCSRTHFKVYYLDGKYYLTDMKSMNGTFVNGVRVEQTEIRHGDTIRAGETLFTFVIDEQVEDPLVGQRIGSYRILEKLGRGGMGTVYKADQVDLQRIVALKVVSKEHTKDPTFTELLVHEARAAAKLNHPNIVQVYDVKRFGDLYYFSMEYVPGGNLQELLAGQHMLPVAEALPMMLDAVRGMQYAHNKKLIHRDLKPDNLMLTETGNIKIGDMGLARRPDERLRGETVGMIMGTPHYIAPELLEGAEADFQSDIYSLGAAFYRILSGITPYSAENMRELIMKKRETDPEPLHYVSPKVPTQLSEIIHKMMARDRSVRYASMTHVLRDLEIFHKSFVEKDQLMRYRRKLALIAAGVIMVLGIAGVLGALVFLRDHEIDRSPKPQPPGDKIVEQHYLNAQTFELDRMDEGDPASIQEAIGMYQLIVDEYPKSTFAPKARQKIAKLLQQLAGLKLKGLLKEEEKIYQQFKQSRELSVFDQIIDEFEKLGYTPEFRGLATASEALQRSRQIREWKDALFRLKRLYNQRLQKVQRLIQESRFQEAIEVLGGFIQTLHKDAIKPGPYRDRYTGFPSLEAKGKLRIRQIAEQAEKRFQEIRDKADELASHNKYQEAIASYKIVFDAFKIPELIRRAEKEQEVLKQRWQDWKREQERVLLIADRKRYDDVCFKIYERVCKNDFLGALKIVEGARPFKTLKLQERLKDRAQELSQLVRLKNALIDRINSKDAKEPINLDPMIPLGPNSLLRGIAKSADNKKVNIEIQGSVAAQVEWQDLSRSAMYELFKKGWRLSEDETRWFALWCLERGLYQEAKLMFLSIKEDKKYSEESRHFAQTYLGYIEELNFINSEEVEALKRLQNLEALMSAGQHREALKELQLLHARYGQTSTYLGRRDKIKGYRQEIESSLSPQELKKLRYMELVSFVRGEFELLGEGREQIMRTIERIEKGWERNLLLGEAYLFWGDLDNAWKQLREVTQKAQQKDGITRAYSWLYKIAVLKGFKKKIKELAKEIEYELDQGNVAGTLKVHLHRWEHTYKKIKDMVPGDYLERIKRNPERAEGIWELANYYEGVCDFKNALACYKALLEYYGDSRYVKSGECVYRIADLYLGFKDVREALKYYRKVFKYPEHPRIRDGTVQRKRAYCNRLLRIFKTRE